MSDAKLKKKVQLKQKTEEPVVQLKRKGGTAAAVHLKRKTGQDATTAAEAASATMSPKTTAVQVQSKPANATAAPADRANNPKCTPVSAPSGEKSISNNNSTATTGNSGKVVGWIIGVAALAGLAFGGYKLIDSNTGDKSLLADSGTMVTTDEVGNLSADSDLTNTQEYRTETDNAIGNSNDTTVTDNATDGASGANGTNGSAANATDNGTINVAGTQNGNEGAHTTSNHGSNGAANKSGATENSSANQNSSNGIASPAQNVSSNVQTGQGTSSGTVTTATDSSTTATGNVAITDAGVTTADVNVENYVPAFTVNRISESNVECLFEFDSSAVSENQTLNDVAEIAKKSGKSVTISGFTDKVGSHDYNQWLSKRRANAIKAYLVKKGVSSEKIKANGYGISNSYPTNAKNRRADIALE